MNLIDSKYKTGQLVTVSVSPGDKGYSTYFGDDVRGYTFYERIDLKSYPSHNDFHGNEVRLRDGDKATVVKTMGYPDRLFFHMHKHEYTVYEILVNGAVCHAFQKDLTLISFPEDLNIQDNT